MKSIFYYQGHHKKVATRIKEDVVWWSAGAETPRLLTDGQPEDQFALLSRVVVRAPRCFGR